MKADLNPDMSVITPNKGGMTAPPTIAVQRRADPFGFKFPKPAIDNVKIVGNIIELNNPTNSAVQNANKPVLDIVKISRKIEPVAKIPSNAAGFR